MGKSIAKADEDDLLLLCRQKASLNHSALRDNLKGSRLGEINKYLMSCHSSLASSSGEYQSMCAGVSES